jgi:hypothetical protein
MESKLAKIILLDGAQLDFYLTPEILTSDLLDMISSYLSLKDKEYFGISYIDATSHRNWLQLDKKVLDHDIPKKANNLLILFFRVKFYLESIAMTKDRTAVELFYQQAKLSLVQNEVEISNDLVYELTALVIQSLYGDYKNDAECLKLLKLPQSQLILPKNFLLTGSTGSSPTSTQKERKIISFYKKCVSMNRGQCIVNYLSIIEKLNNYGVHYYEVKDKSNVKWYLGISFRGIGLYEIGNKITPKKLFLWSKLENLYYRDRKFSIEVHEQTNLNQVKENVIINTTTTTNNNNNNNNDNSFNPVKVYAWFASIPSLCKSIWLMAVSQHQFYLDKKQNKDGILLQYKSLNDLAQELTTPAPTPTPVTTTTTQQQQQQQQTVQSDGLVVSSNDDMFNEKNQMLFLLKKKQEIINQQLNVKKTICDKIRMKQQDISEMSKLISDNKACIYNVVSMVNELKQMLNEFEQNKYHFQLILDEEFETQKKIMFIALNLASDPNASPNVLKARRQLYEKSKLKYSKLEKKRELEQNNKLNFNLLLNADNSNKSSISPSTTTTTTTTTTTSSSGNNNNNNHQQVQAKLNSYFNDDVISMFDSISPASIHRKDSYRRAQEQKLFLENNINLASKSNRNINGRRVKNIWNSSNNNSEIQTANNDNNNVFVNNLYDIKSFKDTDLTNNNVQTLPLNDLSSNSSNNNNNNNNNDELLLCFETKNTNDTNNIKLKKEISTINCKYNNDLYQNELTIEQLNNQINEISLKGKYFFNHQIRFRSVTLLMFF